MGGELEEEETTDNSEAPQGFTAAPLRSREWLRQNRARSMESWPTLRVI